MDWLRLLTLIREQFAVEDGENAIIEETASGEVGIEDGEAGPPNLAADRPIARIVDNLLDFQIFFYAGENDVDALEEGQRVKIRWDENEESLTQAQVIEKGALEDGASYVLLSVSSAEERLFSQRYALCQLVVEGLNGLTVPSSAVFQEDAKDYVFIRKKNYVTQQEVEVVYSDENITQFPASSESLSMASAIVKDDTAAGAAKTADDVTLTEDSLWLPSYVEIVGERPRASFSDGFQYLAEVLNAEGSQYKLFRDQVIYPQEACQELVRNREGEAAYWWLRTASPDVSESEGMAYFNRTGPNGDPFHFATASTDFSGVMFGFCV